MSFATGLISFCIECRLRGVGRNFGNDAYGSAAAALLASAGDAGSAFGAAVVAHCLGLMDGVLIVWLVSLGFEWFEFCAGEIVDCGRVVMRGLVGGECGVGRWGPQLVGWSGKSFCECWS